MKALAIRNLSKTYANGVEALRGIDLEVEPGEFFGLLGPNGAGKSTTIGIIVSLINKSGGTVAVFGDDIDSDFARAKTHMGIVPQEFNFNQFERILHIVANQAGYYGIEVSRAHKQAEIYLRQLGLWDKRMEISRTLSGGMKRRLMIARALVHEPRLLILDEPTAGVDIELRRSMWSFLRRINELGTTIILTTHYLEEAESLCRRIAIIDEGRIIENTTTKQLLSKLHIESFVLDLAHPIAAAPKAESYKFTLVDDLTLEVELSKQQSVSEMFELLNRHGLKVVSLRNKANRLEELFVSMTGTSNHEH